MPPSAQLLLIVIALGGFWFIVMRPARRQQRATMELQRQIGIGDRVVISSGIFGTVRSLDDDRVGLEVAPGVTIEVARQVVVRRLTDELDAPDHQQPDTSSADPDGEDSEETPPRG